jgi:hypothetical protein
MFQPSLTSRSLTCSSISIFSLFPRLFSSSSLSSFSHVSGVRYEHYSLAVLTKFHNFHLHHVGGAGDRGVDIQGVWKLKNRSIPVFCQCKFESHSIGPGNVRELRGVLTSFPSAIGLLISPLPFTKAVETEWRASKQPIILVHLPLIQQSLDSFVNRFHENTGVTGNSSTTSSVSLLEIPINSSELPIQRFSLNSSAMKQIPTIQIVRVVKGEKDEKTKLTLEIIENDEN